MGHTVGCGLRWCGGLLVLAVGHTNCHGCCGFWFLAFGLRLKMGNFMGKVVNGGLLIWMLDVGMGVLWLWGSVWPLL